MKKNFETLSQNIADYEQVIKDQRKRIIDLREENSELKRKVLELEQERSSIAAAMVAAEQSKARIIAEAEKRAERIITAAEADRKKSELAVKYYCNSLHDLEVRCGRILDGITRELSKTEGSSLRLIK